jgi:hypothetical protein
MGIPGDSGAWVVDRDQGAVCGHILAWSERKRVAYICPMDVLLLDIAETLEAHEIRLPGGEVIFSRLPAQKQLLGRTLTQQSSRLSEAEEERVSELGDDEGEEAPSLVSPMRKRLSSRRSQLSHRGSYHRRKSEREQGGDDNDDPFDEAVEVELPEGLKEMQLSDQEMSVGMRRWIA